MYVESMESVLSKSNTVMIDAKSNNLFLPLDKLMQKSTATESETPEVATAPAIEKKVIEPIIQRLSTRGREERGRE
jgi:hypothetical protein